MGVPVRFDANLAVLSHAKGIWPWKMIEVGPGFLTLSLRQKHAVLLHEVGHCKFLHTERILLYTLLRPRLAWQLVRVSIAAARRFKAETPESIAWFQLELERASPGIAAYRQMQEVQADAYAKACGYGQELCAVLAQTGDAGGGFHPELESRTKALIG